jgi:hypothetical protein
MAGPFWPFRLGESKHSRVGLKVWKVIHLQELGIVSHVAKLPDVDAAAVVWPYAEGQ